MTLAWLLELPLARQHGPALLRAAWERRSWPCLDAAVHLMIPPFALLAAGTGALAALRLAVWAAGGPALPAAAWLALLGAQAFYVLAGCTLARVPARAYAALVVYGPVYAAAKVWYCLRRLASRPRGWVPTPRRAVPGERAA